LIESEMGVPRVMPRTIELPGVGNVPGAMVNVGNPHFVLFVEKEDFSAHGLSWQELGARISTNPLFSHGTNVEFVRVLSHSEIAFRIYERGCGPTTSSGTGTCASSAAAMTLRGVDRELAAVAEGGAQRTVWPSSDAVMRLTGPAEIICVGEVSAL
jgi:diaminopimelate epimerase